MRDIFFTSDTHFGHDNIRSHCNRPFASVEEMDEAMIRRWNETVGVADIVYHLGDFAWRIQPHMVQILVGRLNGEIHLVPGNHDRIEMLRHVIGMRIEPHVLTTQVDSRALVLCHYSLRSWPGRVYGSYALWGHSHGHLGPYGKSFDVGVDSHEFRPWTWDEVKEKCEKLDNGVVTE